VIQFQPLPQLQTQPTGAALACPFQPHSVQPHQRHLRIICRWFDIGGKQFQLLRFALFVKDLDGFQPASLRRTVQLAQVAERLLPRPVGSPYGFD
jgi:hypothetical protein